MEEKELVGSLEKLVNGLRELGTKDVSTVKDQIYKDFEQLKKQINAEIEKAKLEVKEIQEGIKKTGTQLEANAQNFKNALIDEGKKQKGEIDAKFPKIIEQLNSLDKSVSQALDLFKNQYAKQFDERLTTLANEVANQSKYIGLHKRIVVFAQEVSSALNKLSTIQEG